MVKITFVGAGSTVFAKNVLGDCMLTPSLRDAEIALYDIDAQRLEESFLLITRINENVNEGRATVKKYHGVENRADALAGATFVVNAMQVGGYEPCTVIDFEIPKKYGLRQTIGDTLGIGGIFRALRTIRDRDGNDLYPEIRRRAREMNAAGKHSDMVRFDYIDKFGYYCTESSEHNAEYNYLYIKENRPELIEKFNIPLDEYPRRCINQIAGWNRQKEELMAGGNVTHTRSGEYASYIMDAMVTGVPYKIGGNVLNHGLISNLPPEACVEVSCLVDNGGIHPTYAGALPLQLAAMNMTNINVQLLTIAAAHERSMEHVYHAAMLDPHTGSQLSTDEIVALCDELRQAHEAAGFPLF